MALIGDIEQVTGVIANYHNINMIAWNADNKDTINKAIELMKRNMMQVPIDWGLDKVPFLVDYKLCYQWEIPIEQ